MHSQAKITSLASFTTNARAYDWKTYFLFEEGGNCENPFFYYYYHHKLLKSNINYWTAFIIRFYLVLISKTEFLIEIKAVWVWPPIWSTSAVSLPILCVIHEYKDILFWLDLRGYISFICFAEEISLAKCDTIGLQQILGKNISFCVKECWIFFSTIL